MRRIVVKQSVEDKRGPGISARKMSEKPRGVSSYTERLCDAAEYVVKGLKKGEVAETAVWTVKEILDKRTVEQTTALMVGYRVLEAYATEGNSKKENIGAIADIVEVLCVKHNCKEELAQFMDAEIVSAIMIGLLNSGNGVAKKFNESIFQNLRLEPREAMQVLKELVVFLEAHMVRGVSNNGPELMKAYEAVLGKLDFDDETHIKTTELSLSATNLMMSSDPTMFAMAEKLLARVGEISMGKQINTSQRVQKDII